MEQTKTFWFILFSIVYLINFLNLYFTNKKEINYLRRQLKNKSSRIEDFLIVNRVEIISRDIGREIVIKEDNIELSFQDNKSTLKIFKGYGTTTN